MNRSALRLLSLSALLALAACATPRVTLKHPKTGQVAVCGGSTSGSLLGGYIGHQVEKRSDADCIRRYEAQGFKQQN